METTPQGAIPNHGQCAQCRQAGHRNPRASHTTFPRQPTLLWSLPLQHFHNPQFHATGPDDWKRSQDTPVSRQSFRGLPAPLWVSVMKFKMCGLWTINSFSPQRGARRKENLALSPQLESEKAFGLSELKEYKLLIHASPCVSEQPKVPV